MRRFYAWLLLLWLSGCAPAPSGMIGQSGPIYPLDKLILIENFDFPPAKATNVDLHSAEKFGENLAFYIQHRLKSTGFPNSTVIRKGEKIAGDLLIRATITRASGGNQLHRALFDLFGSGTSEAGATGEIIDLKSAASLAGFAFSAHSSFPWLSNEMAVRQNLKDIAAEIVRIFLANQKNP